MATKANITMRIDAKLKREIQREAKRLHLTTSKLAATMLASGALYHAIDQGATARSKRNPRVK